MIDKIIITSDFLRWSHDKMSNKWFSQLFEFYLEHVTMKIRETPSKKSQEIIDYETFFRN